MLEVGRMVIVKDIPVDACVQNKYGDIYFEEEMRKYVGRVYKVVKVDKLDNTYKLDSVDDYWFDESWLEEVPEEILFAKLKEENRIPTKREEDGCYDIYACFEEENFVIPPHQVKLVPTGIASAFSPKYRIAIRERGSNTKGTLIVMAGQIDSGFRGEWFVALYNGNDVPVAISKEVKEVYKCEDYIQVPYCKAIAQFAVEIVPKVETKEISYEELKNIKSERGTGCLGSSQK